MTLAYEVIETGDIVTSYAVSKAVSLEVKDFGTMAVAVGGTQFAGSMGSYHVQTATVGGIGYGTATCKKPALSCPVIVM